MAQSGQSEEPYVLYRNTWSIRSLMIRLTLISTEEHPQQPNITIKQKEVDIIHGEQLDEWFLCHINRKGQVPVLTHPIMFSEPVRESVDISYYLCQFYPELLPIDYRDQIKSLLHALHRLNFHVITFAKRPERAAGLIKTTQERLSRSYNSEDYHRALEYKLSMLVHPGASILPDKTNPLFFFVDRITDPEEHNFSPEYIQGQEDQVREILDKATVIRNKHASESPWIFGTRYATILDTHLIPVIVRLRDIGSTHLVGETMTLYAQCIVGTEMWTKLIGNQPTTYVPGKSEPLAGDL
ncbi:hypothetical protein BGW36DRAFT_426422 [Talaromyces proteolyticus]|uniref:GST N-terminal domain-containing protein n=1 Tax=Talaromyces proteolyticus TaxID=1131652 RepID=A0AAD4Q1Q0_9EURO|nr:uncharacterized protein BGW36DRAFT_426422 [Talaromyces proteolyticus]KAH8698730.1 hypothetical protein BGW36DRAFT_426422 [Talaromyces proteolyticus]